MKLKILRQIWIMSKFILYGTFFQVLLIGVLMAENSNGQKQSVYDIYIDVAYNNTSLDQVLADIENKTGFSFTYNHGVVSEEDKINIEAKNQSLGNILSTLSSKNHLMFKRIDGNIHIRKKSGRLKKIEEIFTAENGRQLKVTGTVTSEEDGEPLPGVSILLSGTSTGTTTNLDGYYSINVPADAILQFSYIGYITQEVEVGNRSVIDLKLSADLEQLEEVVVIGYGSQRKSDLTGSVAVVETDEIQKMAVNDITKALQGRIAGVTVQSGGEPGAVPVVKIRGIGSFNNNTPLYIVDGIVTPINDLPMSDIESMQVLKDGAAAAIYGSRAANGVVIITTKRGAKGPLKLNYSGYYGVQNVPTRYDVANREEYQLLVNEASVNAGEALKPANDPSSSLFVNDVDTDWQEEVFKTGKIQEHNLNFTGGNETSTFNISLNYFDQTGTVVGRGPKYTRYGIGVNSDHQIGKLKIGESIHYTVADQTFMTFLHTGNNLVYMVNAIPTLPVYDESTIDGYASADQVIHGSYTANVAGMNNMIESETDRYRFIGNVYGEYAILNELKYKLSLSFERTDWRDFYFQPVHDLGWFYVNNIAKMNDWRGFGSTGTIEQTLTWNKNIGNHALTAMVGTTMLESSIKRTYGHAEGFTEPYFKVLSQGTSGQTITSDEYQSRLMSFFGRVTYNYRDKYLLNATIRRDGSSRFADINRFGTFPAISVGWNVHNEAFMSGVSLVNQLKIRASYGVLGNQEIGDYRYAATITPYAHYVLNGQLATGASQYTFVSPDIKWESKISKNIAVDMAFLDDKITFTAEYYNNLSEDMLVGVPIPGSTGAYDWEAPTINGASVRNSGFEFTLGYRKAEGDFNYGINANISTLKNEVLSLGYGDNPIYGTMSRTAVGSEVGEFYGWVDEGIFQSQSEIDELNEASPINRYQEVDTSPGDVKYSDLNGDGYINDDDRKYLGSAIPNLYYGMNFNASYKNFDLTIAANGSSGNMINNGIRRAIENGSGWDNYSKNMLNRWTPQNTNTDVPRVVMYDPNNNNRDSQRWLEDGKYLKITNVELGYNVPSSITSKAHISSLRVYLSGQNVYTFTKYTGFDPDFGNDGLFSRGTDKAAEANRSFTAYSGGLPNPRTFLLGVKVGF